jgi:hypothetical protein
VRDEDGVIHLNNVVQKIDKERHHCIERSLVAAQKCEVEQDLLLESPFLRLDMLDRRKELAGITIVRLVDCDLDCLPTLGSTVSFYPAYLNKCPVDRGSD